MDGTSQLMWGMLFGAVGFGFLMYGKKQKAVAPLCAGIALCVSPYVISNVYVLVITGAALVVMPFVVNV